MQFRTRPSLIARLRNFDDDDAWREFTACYRPFIDRVGKDAGLSADALADMAQDVLFTVMKALPRFSYDPGRGRFRSWLARVVRTRCIDLSRKQARESAARRRALESAIPKPVPEDAEASSAAAQTLKHALDRLQASSLPQTWKCFELHVLKARAAADVSRELGISINAVYVNASRIVDRVDRECRRLSNQDQWP